MAAKCRVGKLVAEKPRFLKSDLVNMIEDHIFLPKSEVKRFVDLIFHIILLKAKEGYNVRINNFGSFSSYLRKGHTGRNPHTGVEVELPPRNKLRFKASEYSEAFLDEGFKERLLASSQTHTHTSTAKHDKLLEQVLVNPLEGYTPA